MNLVVIVVDTLRQDHLGTFGSAVPTSPNLDAIAAQGVSFTRCSTVSPWTLPSIASLQTGLYPRGHGVHRPNMGLAPEAVTLAEILAEKGYATAGVVSHVLLRERYGTSQGFAAWDETQARGHDSITTPGVSRLACRELERLSQGPAPFFLFVHFFDPHYAFQRHPEFGLAGVPSGRLQGGEEIHQLLDLAPTLTPEEWNFLQRTYDEEIRFTDAGIGAVAKQLESLGIDEKTVVVVTADHGEEFGTRANWIGHTISLYDEDIRIPLVVRDPRGSRTRRIVKRSVSTVDVAPTLLEVLDVDAGKRRFHGRSFARLLTKPGAEGEGPVFLEVDFVPLSSRNEEKISKKQGMIEGRWKFIRDEVSGTSELYDLERDPGERTNLASALPDSVDRFARELDERMGELGAEPLTPAPVELTEQQRERLRSLGYTAE